MAGFRRTLRGVTARFTAGQAGILRNLVGQGADLVGGPGAADAPPAGEPAEPGGGADLPLDVGAIFAMDAPAAGSARARGPSHRSARTRDSCRNVSQS